MTPPTRDAASVEAAAAIAQLRQHIRVWMDGDRVLPADGSLLLATLDQIQAGLAGGDAPGVGAEIAAFVSQVQALVEAGVLTAEESHPLIEAAAEMAAWHSHKKRGDL